MLAWFDRKLTFERPVEMLPYYLIRLEGTLPRLREMVADCSEELLAMRFENKWSVKENIGHLGEVDEIACKRIDEMRRGVPNLAPAVFEPHWDFNRMPIFEILNYFHVNRKKNLEQYRSLDPAELKQSSMHPRLRVKMTPVDLAWFDAEHDDHHLVRIKEILSSHE
jgi:DinB superfamily